MTTFYSCCRQGLSILLLALLAPVLQADAPSVSNIFPAGGSVALLLLEIVQRLILST